MSNLASSFKGADAATAFARGMSPERFAERSAARTQKEQSEQDLERLQKTKLTEADYDKLTEIQTAQLDEALRTLDQNKRDMNMSMTYDAFTRYDDDNGNVDHFNTLIKQLDKRGSSLFGDIARVDRINTTDIIMMDQTGLNKALQNEILNNHEVAKSYVKITAKDGSISFGDMDMLKSVATGYTQDIAPAREKKRMEMVRETEYLTSIGIPTTVNSREAFRAARADFPDADPNSSEFQEAYKKRLDELRTTGKGRYSSRNATNEEGYAERALAAEGLAIGDSEYETRYNELVAEYRNLRKTSTKKNLEGANEAEDRLMDHSFFDEEQTITRESLGRKGRMAIERDIRALEQQGGAELKADTRKSLLQIRGLAHLGDKAGQLTRKETGLMDNFLFGVRKYFTDTTTGVEATAAYAEYRNLARHALFGSVLPMQEVKSFIESFGSLKQQVGPILAHLKSSMEKVKGDYDTIAAGENELVMLWRTGMTEDELDNTIRNLDQRIHDLGVITNDIPQTVQTTPIDTKQITEMDPERKADLAKILGIPLNPAQEIPE